MDIKDICEAGGDILNTVADAVNRNDYTGLSDNIRGTVNRVVNQAQQDFKRDIGYHSHVQQGERFDSFRPYTNYQDVEWSHQSSPKAQTGSYRQLPVTVTRRPAGKLLGPIQLGGGIVTTSLFGVSAVVMAILLATVGGGVFGVLTAVFGGLSLYGVSHIIRGNGKVGLVNRFYRYARIIGNKSYIAVSDLAAQTGMSSEKVVKDLKKMIGKRMFPQGSLDAGEKTFMLTQEVYDEYQKIETERRRMDAEALARSREEEERRQNIQENGAYNEETKKILAEGNEYIQMVRRRNEEIPGEVMSDKLTRLETIMRRIFEQVEKNPESAENLHKFMTYYLPTTKKLLDAYIDLDRQEISGDTIKKTKKEIEDTLDTINEAFEQLLDSMFVDTAWDISSDISVMKTLMAQEGLMRDGIKADSRQI